MSKKDLEIIIATDCGGTTTKAILIEKKGDTYRQTFRGEAPTTVEAPFEDVTKGVLNSITEVEELSGRKLLDGEHIITPNSGNTGADIYVSTSSAGGGLQMMVAGAVKAMTGESAQRQKHPKKHQYNPCDYSARLIPPARLPAALYWRGSGSVAKNPR